MEAVFTPLISLYAASRGGLNLAPAQLGYELLSAGAVRALTTIADVLQERDEHLHKPKKTED